MEKKKILLLGGTGTLSSAVLNQALTKGYSVTIMNRGSNNRNLPSCVKVVLCDFKNTTRLNDLFANCYYDVIVDFLSRIPADIKNVYSVFGDKCQQYIFISSSCVYCRNNSHIPIIETTEKPNKRWSYNVEKFECEEALKNLSEKAKSYYTIVRPYITYNEERIPVGISPAYKFHSTIIERIKSGKPWFVWDEGTSITTLTYSEDFAFGVVGLFLNDMAKNEDFHITGDYTYSQLEVTRLLFKKLNIPEKIVSIRSEKIVKTLPEYDGLLFGDRVSDAIFDNSKIKKAVPGLVFKTSLEDGLTKIIDYWNNHMPLYDYRFEGRIDRMLSFQGIKTSYVHYYKAKKSSRILYLLYKYLPLRFAMIFEKWVL